jgi:ATP-dependent Clp protease adaptor protein ClpS
MQQFNDHALDVLEAFDDLHETGEDGDTAVDTMAAPPRVLRLPPWDVLLHNDDVNDMVHVVETIQELVALDQQHALLCMLEAHNEGVAILITTHRERAELLQEQFDSRGLTVSIEPSCGAP